MIEKKLKIKKTYCTKKYTIKNILFINIIVMSMISDLNVLKRERKRNCARCKISIFFKMFFFAISKIRFFGLKLYCPCTISPPISFTLRISFPRETNNVQVEGDNQPRLKLAFTWTNRDKSSPNSMSLQTSLAVVSRVR